MLHNDDCYTYDEEIFGTIDFKRYINEHCYVMNIIIDRNIDGYDYEYAGICAFLDGCNLDISKQKLLLQSLLQNIICNQFNVTYCYLTRIYQHLKEHLTNLIERK